MPDSVTEMVLILVGVGPVAAELVADSAVDVEQVVDQAV